MWRAIPASLTLVHEDSRALAVLPRRLLRRTPIIGRGCAPRPLGSLRSLKIELSGNGSALAEPAAPAEGCTVPSTSGLAREMGGKAVQAGPCNREVEGLRPAIARRVRAV